VKSLTPALLALTERATGLRLGSLAWRVGRKRLSRLSQGRLWGLSHRVLPWLETEADPAVETSPIAKWRWNH